MSESQKTLIFMGLLFCLFALAFHLLFAQRIKAELTFVQGDYQQEILSEGLQIGQDETDLTALQENTLKLRRYVVIAQIIQTLFFMAGGAALIASLFFRDKRRDENFEDEWEDDWDEDDDDV